MATPAPQPHIPFAFLPRVADTASLLNMSIASGALLLLLVLDVWRSKTKKTHWIRGESFVLGALTLQFLDMLYHPIVSISDTKELNPQVVEGLFDKIYTNQVVILGERVAMCVFIGILLPRVPRLSEENMWSDILALAISATRLLIHISYDMYIVVIRSWIDHGKGFQWNYWKVWMLASNTLIFVSIVLLVLLLGCAALARDSIQEVVAQRIRVLLFKNPGTQVSPEEQVMRSWIIVRTHQPQYIIARSVLVASTGFLVSVCILFAIVASTKNGYVSVGDGYDWSRVIVLLLEWIFILSGWGIVCWRWITAVVYYKKVSSAKAYFRVEDFWKRGMLELEEELIDWDIESMKKLKFLNWFIFNIVHKLRVYKLLPVLRLLQIFLIQISKTISLISEAVLCNHCMRRLLMGQELYREFWMLNNKHMKAEEETERSKVEQDAGGDLEAARKKTEEHNLSVKEAEEGASADFLKYKETLMHMPGENQVGVWIAIKKSFQEMKEQREKGELRGKQCKELINFVKNYRTQDLRSTDPFAISYGHEVEGDFNVQGKNSIKMTVVSLLAIIIELSAFYQTYGRYQAADTATDAVKQAWEILQVVENPDSEAVLVIKQANKVFHGLKESPTRWLSKALPINKSKDRSFEDAKSALKELADIGKQMANDGFISGSGYDSKNWKAVFARNNLCNLCESIKSRSNSIDEMLHATLSSLANVLGSCMFKVEEIIVDRCSLWSQTLMEEKLWNAFYIAAQARGVIQQLQPEPQLGETQGQMIPTNTDERGPDKFKRSSSSLTRRRVN